MEQPIRRIKQLKFFINVILTVKKQIILESIIDSALTLYTFYNQTKINLIKIYLN